MKKRIIPLLLVLILSLSLSISAGAVPYIPDDVTYQNLNGTQFAIKVFTLLPDQDPAELIEDDFEYGGWLYTYADIVKEELIFSTQTQHQEIVTVETATKNLEDILAELEPTIEYRNGDTEGTLTLDHNSLKTEVAGYQSGSYTVTATKNYTGLDRNDSSYIDKTAEKDGRTLSLSNVVWSVESTTLVGDELIPASYSAVATYTGTAYYNKATGYLTTAEYNGTVTSSGISGIRYTVTYIGTLIEPEATPEPEPDRSIIEPEPNEPVKEPGPSPLPWIFGGIAIISAGLLLYAFLLRKNITVYESTGDENEFDKIGSLHLDPRKPDFRVDRFRKIPEGLIAVEIDGATARRLFGKTLSIHHYNHTLQHTVGAANASSYWFKLDLAPAAEPTQEAMS
jgi:hypothetical protein